MHCNDGVNDTSFKAKDLTAETKAKDLPVKAMHVIYQRLEVTRSSGQKIYIVKSK